MAPKLNRCRVPCSPGPVPLEDRHHKGGIDMPLGVATGKVVGVFTRVGPDHRSAFGNSFDTLTLRVLK